MTGTAIVAGAILVITIVGSVLVWIHDRFLGDA